MKRLALVVAALLLAACGPGITEGHIVAKQIIPAHDSSYPIFTTICTSGYKGTISCHQQWIGQGTRHHPTEWQIQVRDASGDTEWKSVPEAYYQRAYINDTWRAEP